MEGKEVTGAEMFVEALVREGVDLMFGYPGGVVLKLFDEFYNRRKEIRMIVPRHEQGGGHMADGYARVTGRVGTLLCWESFMPLARYALYAQGIEIYIAPTYDSGDGWIGTLQHIAREAKCWVVGSGYAIKGSDIPEDFPNKKELYPDPKAWVNPGDSVVVAPGGEIVAGPLRNEQGILYAEIDSQRTGIAKRALDITGHYARPDIFQLHVNTQPQSPVKFD